MMRCAQRKILPQLEILLLGMMLWLAADGALSAAAESFPGEVVEVAGQTLAPGVAELVISLELPPGYELIPEAPIMAAVTSGDSGVVAVRQEAGAPCPKSGSDLRFPLQANPGETRLQADLVVYYCQKEKAALCITRQARLLLPVRVEEAAANKELRASYKLPAL